MLVQFDFEDGSNPYITKTNKELFKMLKKYHYIQLSEHIFFIDSFRGLNGKYNYQDNKLVAAAIARDWQQDFNNMNYSMDDIENWQRFFKEIGKKYGLLKEFRENAII